MKVKELIDLLKKANKESVISIVYSDSDGTLQTEEIAHTLLYSDDNYCIVTVKADTKLYYSHQ